jgi:uncharacterized protein (DUF362 family)
MNPALDSRRVGVSVDARVRGLDPGGAYGDPERISALVRDALLQGGLGRADPDAPLADIVPAGGTVLLKPNWVHHENASGRGLECLVTDPSFVVAVLREVDRAKPGRIVIGDAPIQGCRFDRLVTAEWRERFAGAAGCPVEIVDFRRTRLVGDSLFEGVVSDLRPPDRYVLFDLARDSLLEPISRRPGRFRVVMYNPDEMAAKHGPGRHQYLLAREPFEADVVISLPKLKCHKKAGITGALKNLVGVNGNKDYLPHHRVGGSRWGGDCYEGFAPLKRISEFLLDGANRRINRPAYRRWAGLAARMAQAHDRLWRGGDGNLEGSWHGNDTVWRMSLDLNRLLRYGRADGTIGDAPLRTVYSITDAIVAGEGAGPLAPAPVPLGVVTFASSSAFAEVVHAALMRFDHRRVPLIREAFAPFRYPIAEGRPEMVEAVCGGRRLELDELAEKIGVHFDPPAGWKGRLERNAADPAEARK